MHTSRCADVGDEKQPGAHSDETTLWKKVRIVSLDKLYKLCSDIIISPEILEKSSSKNLSIDDLDVDFRSDNIATIVITYVHRHRAKNFHCFARKKFDKLNVELLKFLFEIANLNVGKKIRFHE